MMSCPVLDHPMWPLIRPWIHVETYDRDGGHTHPRHRFEIVLPRNVAFRSALLDVECPCCACGAVVHPFRAREGDAADSTRLYVAVACELAKGYGCARGRAARLAYDALLAACSTAAPFVLT